MTFEERLDRAEWLLDFDADLGDSFVGEHGRWLVESLRTAVAALRVVPLFHPLGCPAYGDEGECLCYVKVVQLAKKIVTEVAP